MTNVRRMLARVTRLEAQRAAPRTPIEVWYGSFDSFESETLALVDDGKLDRMDWLGADGKSGVLMCLKRLATERVWMNWR